MIIDLVQEFSRERGKVWKRYVSTFVVIRVRAWRGVIDSGTHGEAKLNKYRCIRLLLIVDESGIFTGSNG